MSKFRPLVFSFLSLTTFSLIVLSGCTQPADNTSTADTESASDYVVNPGGATTGKNGETDFATVDNPPTDDAVVGEVTTDLEPSAPTLETFVERIQQALQSQDLEKAVATANEARVALPNEPNTVVLMANIGMLVARMGDVDRGLEMLQDLPEAKTDPNVRMVLLQLYQQKSQSTTEQADALAAIQKATDIVRDIGKDEPWAGSFFYDEAVLLAKAGETDKSLAVLREAFESGYAELSAPLSEEAFADNAEAAAIIEEFAAQIREKYREEIREEMLTTEAFPFSFELTNVAGETVSTEAMKGRVAIVDFWGTWCPPCRMEIPHFVELTKNFANDLNIVGLNYNEPGDTDKEQAEHIAAFMTDNEMTYQCAVGDEATMEQVPNLEGFPTTLFLDRTGKVRLKLVGYHPYEKLEAAVLELSAEAAPPAEAAAGDNKAS